MPSPTRRDVPWLILWGSLSSAWCVAAAFAVGPTYDEPFYLRAGAKSWRAWDRSDLLAVGTMPLPAEVQTLPRALTELVGGLPAYSDDDLATWLPVSRVTALVFWWLLLWSAGRLAGCYGGTMASRVAVAVIACQPVLLGHAVLATTDVPFAACLIALIASFRLRRDEPSWRRRLLPPALWFALTFLAKASALMFVPVCLFAVEAERLVRSGSFRSWPVLRKAATDLTTIAGAGTVLLFVLCPHSLWAFSFQLNHNRVGHGSTFLHGKAWPGGIWYYFPASLAIKFGPVLWLFVAATVMRPRAWANGATVAALGLLACTPLMKVQIGVRFVFAIAILAAVGAAGAYGVWHAAASPARRRRGLAVVAALVAMSAVEAVWVWPHGMCYTSPVFGGTAHGDGELDDSNYDWGQGLPALRAWADTHADAPLHLYYFGQDPAHARPPFTPRPAAEAEDPSAFAAANRGAYVAVSTNFVRSRGMKEYLRTVPLAGRTRTYRIYDLRAAGP